MTKSRILLMLIVLLATFLLVYAPHYRYAFPRHVDEWHHITETIKLERGEYSGGLIGFRFGFHLILLLLSKIANLITIYRFLPAIWAAFSNLVLFYIVYKKTDKGFFTALSAMIFFASIKSNVNITGLWFFTPLTFSIPFIFLYVYFFTEGVEKQNKKFILMSLVIMAALLFVHSISVLFAIPFLFLYSLFNFGYIKKEWKFFFIFLIIPVLGALLFKSLVKSTWESLVGDLIHGLQIRRSWGVLEMENSPLELYSLVGYLLAMIGIAAIFGYKKNLKRYLAYGLWTISLLISIILYNIRNISYLSPYQRNLYYFAISLPLLSALGLDYLLKKQWGLIIKTLIFSLIIIFVFKGYLDIPKQVELYKVIDNDDYEALKFLSAIPEKSTVMAIPRVSITIYPISGHKPVGAYFFYGSRQDADKFFSPETNLEEKQQLLKNHGVKYVLSKSKFEDYGWKIIYDKGCYIYEVN